MLPDSGEFLYHLYINALQVFDAPRTNTHRLVLALVPSANPPASPATSTLPGLSATSLALIDGDLVYDGAVVSRGVLPSLAAGTHVYLAWDARVGRLRIATAAHADAEPVVRYNGQPAVVPRGAYVPLCTVCAPCCARALLCAAR
jgi:hypothetical protein